ncbi:MAG TPA: hypothetical protein VH724_04200, partial [Candidatus Angelobacter sp.]|nr:hypothetical protein [Candidatus Angelobacter sp.]
HFCLSPWRMGIIGTFFSLCLLVQDFLRKTLELLPCLYKTARLLPNSSLKVFFRHGFYLQDVFNQSRQLNKIKMLIL